MRRLVIGVTIMIAGWSAVQACELVQVNSKWDLWRGAICLRGANLWQKRVVAGDDTAAIGSGPLGPPYSSQGLAELAQWGANYINVSHPGIFTEAKPYKMDLAAKSNLDSILEMAGQANLFVVIGFRTGPGRTEKAFTTEGGKKDHLVWKKRSVQDAWVQMWRDTAALYKGNPLVVGYELMVEPNSNGALLGIYDSKTFLEKYADSTYNWYPLAQRIAAAIREVDPFTPILVGGMNWSSVDWLESIPNVTVPRVVYVAHQYEPFTYTHQSSPLNKTYPGFFDGNYDGVAEAIDKNFLVSLLEPVRRFKQVRQAPVTVNEFGLIRYEPGAVEFLKDHFAIFEDWQVSSALWLWESDYPGVDWHEFNVRYGVSPSATGEVVDSPLERVIRSAWAKNQLRPSDVNGKW